MMIRRMSAHGEGQSVPIHNRQDFHALVAFRESDGLAATLVRRTRGIDETLPFVEHPFVAQRVRHLGEDFSQHLLLTPLLEATMHRFVIRIALGQEVPLRARVQNPEDGIQDGASRDRFAARPIVWNMLFGKMVPDPLPLVITQPQHAGTYRGSVAGRQLF